MPDEKELQPSQSVLNLMGAFILKNTFRANRTVLKLLAKFVIDGTYKSRYFRTEPYVRSLMLATSHDVHKFEVQELRKVLFRNAPPSAERYSW